MIIRRLHLVGFGKFTDYEIELEEGLNVFYGSNESGKTTIQSFLKGMLYGFKRPDVRRRLWTPELERYMPWSGKPYIGAMEFTTSEGRTYYVERAFAKEQDSVRILDAITGRDMSSLFELDERCERLFAENSPTNTAIPAWPRRAVPEAAEKGVRSWRHATICRSPPMKLPSAARLALRAPGAVWYIVKTALTRAPEQVKQDLTGSRSSRSAETTELR